MPTILRRPQFIADISEAWSSLDTENPRAAEAFLYDLEKRFELLSHDPRLGPAPFRRHKDFRIFPFKNFVLIYRPLDQDSGIELVRLVHAAHDYRRVMRDSRTTDP